MDSREQRQATIKPYLQKLKDLGAGLTMNRCLGTRVLIMPITPFTDMDRLEKEGLLIMPEKEKETNTPPPSTGEVLMIGPDVTSVQVGEAVMFSRYAGMQIMLDRANMLLVDEREIACVLNVENPDAIQLTEDNRA